MNILKLNKNQRERLEIYKMITRKIWRDAAVRRGINMDFATDCFDSGWHAVFEAVRIETTK